MSGDAIYSEFITEIGYQVLTSTKIKTVKEENTGNKDDFKEMSTMGCISFMIDLISECQSSVFQWDSFTFDLGK